MPRRLPFSLYDAFPAGPFGGATAGIVSDAAGLSAATMQRIAREVGAPATAFVYQVAGDLIDVRFFSTLTEYGMCGHGTVALVTHLVETGQLVLNDNCATVVTLRTAGGDAPVTVRYVDGRSLVMLDLGPSLFEAADIDVDELARILGISSKDIDESLPIEKAVGDFVHLIVPIPSLDVMAKITPDFGAVAAFSRAAGAQTVAVFTREVRHSDNTLHCRDFCPAVGTPESPAAGDDQRCVDMLPRASHGLIDAASKTARPWFCRNRAMSVIAPAWSAREVTVEGGRIEHLAVGGHARQSIAGELFLPDEDA